MKYRKNETKAYRKDFKQLVRQGINTKKLTDLVDELAVKDFTNAHKNHKLEPKNCTYQKWECHIGSDTSDWVLVYHYNETELVLDLLRTGSHSELFEGIMLGLQEVDELEHNNEAKSFIDKALSNTNEDLEFQPAVAFNSGAIGEDIEKHDELNPDLFEDNELKPEVKVKLEEIVQKFDDNLKEDGVELDVKDIVIVGSNASFNYTKDSDIDLHIVADTSIYKDQKDLAVKLYNAYKSLWNNKYDPKIHGHEVEIYVEPDAIHANSNGMYSLNNGWLKAPEKENIPDIDKDEVAKRLKPFEDRFKQVETIEDIDKLIDDIYLQRQQGILQDGEYSVDNLVFKEFRNKGYLQKLKDKKVELENKEMSLESLQEAINRSFVYMNTFKKALKHLDLDTPDDIRDLENSILSGKPEVSLGSNVFKFRWSPRRWNKGKSGATRVIYIDIIRSETIYLVSLFNKNELANISNAELKSIRKLAKKLNKER